MKAMLTCAVVLSCLLPGPVVFAADLTGKIGDSMCGATHKTMAEHGASKMTDQECTLACVKKGGKYVFISGGKIYQIENQDFQELEKHAGQNVKISGEVKGDAVMLSKIEAVAHQKGKTD
jgi:hypothetical protein